MHYTLRNTRYELVRYPATSNRSLRAWSAADELLLNWWEESVQTGTKLGLWHDRFGGLGTVLHDQQPWQVISYHSQEIGLRQQWHRNGLDRQAIHMTSTEQGLTESIDAALMRIPKSLDLFEWYIRQIAAALSPEGVAATGFMTRHFSPEMLKLAEKYFSHVSQTRAHKKARLLLLREPKEALPPLALKKIALADGTSLQQYPGVFSARHIDPATQMLLDHFELSDSVQRVLDLGCGNGIIGRQVQQQLPEAELHLMDDFHLAIASARLNVPGENTYFHPVDSLVQFHSGFFDLILSNPPFHIEHENNIEVSLGLFKQVKRCLRKGGRFQLVANHHLNYATHLRRMFARVDILWEDKRFVVYGCEK